MKEALLNEIRLALRNNSDNKMLETSSRFFKKGEVDL